MRRDAGLCKFSSFGLVATLLRAPFFEEGRRRGLFSRIQTHEEGQVCACIGTRDCIDFFFAYFLVMPAYIMYTAIEACTLVLLIFFIFLSLVSLVLSAVHPLCFFFFSLLLLLSLSMLRVELSLRRQALLVFTAESKKTREIK